MLNTNSNFFVITGGPGVGKTTLIQALNNNGFRYIPEIAREIIKEQEETGGDALPWKNNELYTSLMMEKSVLSYMETKNQISENEVIFFDRGILDSLCHARLTGLNISKQMNHIATHYLYNRNVFLLPPWTEIYTNDEERKQNWDEAVSTYHRMKEIYSEYGYNLIEVPKDNLENRIRFITGKIASIRNQQ